MAELIIQVRLQCIRFINKMGNRGSKSESELISVKEQRVDGSYWI